MGDFSCQFFYIALFNFVLLPWTSLDVVIEIGAFSLHFWALTALIIFIDPATNTRKAEDTSVGGTPLTASFVVLQRSSCCGLYIVSVALLQLHDGLHLALGDGDADVVGEQVPEHEGVHHGGGEQRRHGEHGHRGQRHAQGLGEAVVHLGGVADRRGRRAGHRRRVRPPREREPEPAEEVDPHAQRRVQEHADEEGHPGGVPELAGDLGPSVTQILLGGGVSVSDIYRIRIRHGYTSDTFLAIS